MKSYPITNMQRITPDSKAYSIDSQRVQSYHGLRYSRNRLIFTASFSSHFKKTKSIDVYIDSKYNIVRITKNSRSKLFVRWFQQTYGIKNRTCYVTMPAELDIPRGQYTVDELNSTSRVFVLTKRE